MSPDIKLTLSQARRIASLAPQGSVYWQEAQRVLREAGSSAESVQSAVGPERPLEAP